jgi:hypothetical protein
MLSTGAGGLGVLDHLSAYFSAKSGVNGRQLNSEVATEKKLEPGVMRNPTPNPRAKVQVTPETFSR